MVTGKPLDLGGSEGRTEATGYGGTFALLTILKHLHKKPEDMTVAVQGFGNVGQYAAESLQKYGFKVVAISDSKGGIYVPEGLPSVAAIAKCKAEKGHLAGCYCIVMHVLIPLEITCSNASGICKNVWNNEYSLVK